MTYLLVSAIAIYFDLKVYTSLYILILSASVILTDWEPQCRRRVTARDATKPMVAPMGTSGPQSARPVIRCWSRKNWLLGKMRKRYNKKEHARSEMCVMWCATCCVVNVLYSHSFWKGINCRIYSNHLFAPFGVPGQLPGSPWPVVSMSIRSCKKTRKEKEKHVQVLHLYSPQKLTFHT